MTSLTGFSPNNPIRYLGPNVAITTVVTRNRAPTGADYRQPETGKLYPFSTLWIVGKDPTTGTQGDLWYLAKIVANIAYWMQLSTGSSGPMLSIDVPLGESPIVPDGTGLVSFTSSDGTVSITGSSATPNNHTINFDVNGGQPTTQFIVPLGESPIVPNNVGEVTFTSSLGSINITGSSAAPNNHTINLDLVGGGVGVDSIQVDSATSPGVNPVAPSVVGLVTMHGAAVANHSVPIETRTRALNALNIEAQYATTAAATDATKSGLAHFDSASFTSDANGFISFLPTVQPWTPVLRFGGASTGITYLGQEGNLVVLGKCVMFEYKIVLTNKGSSTGVATISGLPSVATTDVTSVTLTQNCSLPAGTNSYVCVIQAGTGIILAYAQSSTAIIQLQDTNFTNTSVIQGSGCYFIA